MERKSSREYSVAFFVEGKKFKLRICFQGLHLCFGSAANSVRTMLEFTAFRSGPDAKYSRASALCFFCPQSWFCGGPNKISQEKHKHFHVDRRLVTGKEKSS